MTDSEETEHVGTPGATGRQGEAGVPGRQGEAGVSGWQGQPGIAGSAGPRGAAGPRGTPLSSGRTLALFAFVVAAFFIVAVRSEINARAIDHSNREIGRTQHAQCVIRNEATGRQNTLLDSAIAAEKRRPAPDPQRIRDLTQFKGTILDCGTRP